MSTERRSRRIGLAIEELRQRPFQLHWTNIFGVVAAACLVVLMITGVVLMIFYSPSNEPVAYHGSYSPLNGVEVSRAFQTTMMISFDLPGGIVIRQAHHWSALLLPAALSMQLLIMFFRGAFRRPRRLRWLLVFGLLIVAMLGGWSGYALPDDSLSGTGLRIFEGIVLGIPVIGTLVSALLFGNEFPGRVLEILYPIHIWLVLALLVIVIGGLLRSWLRDRPARFSDRRRIGPAPVEVALFPTAVTRLAGLFAVTVAVIMVMASTMTISPIWLYGPTDAASASAGSQPDWYTGFLDGALRLVPPGWEFSWLGYTWTLAVIAPLAVISAFMLLVAIYPFVEERFTKDRLDHDVLDRPRDAPTRTGVGVAGMIFYGVLWGAASADIAATMFHLSLNVVLTILQVAIITGPVIGFLTARSICRWLQRRDEGIAAHGYETGVIVRLPSGGYVEDHLPALTPSGRPLRPRARGSQPVAAGHQPKELS
jgi:ubiquinol-cytochrome c reductase cytochrome b subunit